MRVLALDTATGATAVAVADVDDGKQPERSATAYREPPRTGPPGHATELLGAVEQVLAEIGGGWEAVDRIAVGIGPGTFTGLRIGVASAQALAVARGLPLVGVSSLHALGLGTGGLLGEDLPLLALIDARRGEVFAAGWPAGADQLQPPAAPEPAVLKPEQLHAHVAPGAVAAGDGAIKFKAVLDGLGVVVPKVDDPANRISAVSHCRLASRLTPARRPDQVQPAYLRIPDAEIQSKR